MSRDRHRNDRHLAEGRHVALVGMAGVGKSSVARRLATGLRRPWCDTDASVSNDQGRTVAEIFAALGEDGFRDLESAALSTALAAEQPCVIATGGGIVERARNRAALADAAVVVWLRADDDVLVDRLRQSPVERPLLGDDVAGTVASLSARREAWYAEIADVVVDVGSTDLAGAVRAVRGGLRAVTTASAPGKRP